MSIVERSIVPPLPEPGQVVEVRGSTWAVANVQVQGLPRSPADEATARLTHVVDLQSLDEDRLSETLSVVWELEVGHTVTPAQGLPDRINPEAFDEPTTLAGFIDAMRWGAVTSADPNRYQAPFWSGVNIEAYQLEPLRRAQRHGRRSPPGLRFTPPPRRQCAWLLPYGSDAPARAPRGVLAHDLVDRRGFVRQLAQESRLP